MNVSGGGCTSIGLAHDDGVDESKLKIDRRTQRPGRNNLTVAEASTPVDYGDRQVLRQRPVLQAIVHDDGADLASAQFDRTRSRRAIVADHCRSDAGEQQRLIPEAPCGAWGILHPGGTRFASAVATRQKYGVQTALEQQTPDSDRQRRLAGAPGREVADADHGKT